jgi:hypothetical protein
VVCFRKRQEVRRAEHGLCGSAGDQRGDDCVGWAPEYRRRLQGAVGVRLKGRARESRRQGDVRVLTCSGFTYVCGFCALTLSKARGTPHTTYRRVRRDVFAWLEQRHADARDGARRELCPEHGALA